MTPEQYKNYQKAKTIEKEVAKKLEAVVPNLKAKSGIYIYTRIGEKGTRYAYIGQAKNMVQRLVQHDVGHAQHIENSIDKHGYWAIDNQGGWKISVTYYPEAYLDNMEKHYIKEYGETYELYNITAGGQGEGKEYLQAPAPRKGYRKGIEVGEARGQEEGYKKGYKQGRLDGIQEGRRTLASVLKHMIDFHLIVSVVKDTKPHQKALEKFNRELEELTK